MKSEQIDEIGCFVVPVHSLVQRSKKPQFFHLINQEGQFVGSVLCNFLLKSYPKVTTKEKKKGYVNKEHEILISEFSEVFEKHYKVNINLGVVGLRNLVKAAIDPVITIRLTSGIDNKDQPEAIQIDKEWLVERCKVS